MIKKSTLIPILIFIFAGIAIALYSALPIEKNKSAQSQLQNYLELSSFPPQTNIEVTYLDNSKIVAENVIIKNKNTVKLELNKTPILSFRISKDNNIYDMNVRLDPDKILIGALGLAPKTKVTLKTDETLSEKAIPVDWAGNIRLEEKLTNNYFCILITNEQTASICHRTQEVPS